MLRTLIFIVLILMLQGCVGGAYISDVNSDVHSISLKNKSEVIAAWGSPYQATESSLVYKLKERRMRGVVLALVVPIPLYLPAGKEEMIFYFNQNELSKVTHRRSKITGGFCGFIPDEATHIEFKFGCDSFNE